MATFEIHKQYIKLRLPALDSVCLPRALERIATNEVPQRLFGVFFVCVNNPTGTADLPVSNVLSATERSISEVPPLCLSGSTTGDQEAKTARVLSNQMIRFLPEWCATVHRTKPAKPLCFNGHWSQLFQIRDKSCD